MVTPQDLRDWAANEEDPATRRRLLEAAHQIEQLRVALGRIAESGECVHDGGLKDGQSTGKIIYSGDLHRQCRVIAHNALT